MSVYEKIFLGWSDYQLLAPGQKATVRVGPATNTTKQAQAIVALLPDKSVTTDIGSPYAGSQFYHSGAGNDLDNSMTKSVTLPAGTVSLSAKVRYDIELDWDYAYLTVNGQGVATNLSTSTSPNGQNFGNGITGSSGGNWVDLTADLSAFAGQTVTLGFRYWTDGATAGSGFGVDDIAVTGQPTDGAESDAGWTFNGFIQTTGSITQSFFNAYFAENRQYTGYDDGLRTGPYNFGFLNTLPDWVEHFQYRPGLLVWYYDTSFPDNNIGDHCLDGRCGGLVLPVDAHPQIAHWADGTMMRPRIQAFDSTFGLDPVPALTLHNNGVEATIPASPAAKVFNDSTDQWFACDSHCVNGVHPGRYQPGWSGVNTPDTGTTMRVKSASSTGFLEVDVNK
jgi:immune inhibitor A